jgi:hypothetical protein
LCCHDDVVVVFGVVVVVVVVDVAVDLMGKWETSLEEWLI